MRITIESALVQTLKPDGRPWDGPGGARIPPSELASFFALDLGRQLERLVATGVAPDPPEVFVRLYAGGKLALETIDRSSFDPSWERGAGGDVAVAAGEPLTVEVWDKDLLFHDLIGRGTFAVPSEEELEGGRWRLGPFGQVRSLVLRMG